MRAFKVSFNFYLRSPISNTETPIHLFVSWHNQRIVIPTPCRIHPKYWDKKKQKCKDKAMTPEKNRLDAILKKFESDAEKLFNDFTVTNERYPSKDELRALYNVELSLKGRTNTFNERMQLIEFIETYIKDSTTRQSKDTNKRLSPRTIQSYERTLYFLKDYNSSVSPVTFNSIDMDFYNSFYNYLLGKNYAANTIGKHIKRIKEFMNKAVEKGLTKNEAFKNKDFKILKEDSHNIALSETEIKLLYKLDLSKEVSYERTRDLFVIGCLTGLRFSDFTRLDKSHFKDGLIHIRTQKTNEDIIVPAHPIVIEIMEKYNYTLSKQANTKFNKNIKLVAAKVPELCQSEAKSMTKGGIEVREVKPKHEYIGSHTCRRSFATNQYYNGVPAITIMSATGHKTETSFLQYIKVDKEEHARKMKGFWNNKK